MTAKTISEGRLNWEVKTAEGAAIVLDSWGFASKLEMMHPEDADYLRNAYGDAAVPQFVASLPNHPQVKVWMNLRITGRTIQGDFECPKVRVEFTLLDDPGCDGLDAHGEPMDDAPKTVGGWMYLDRALNFSLAD